MPSEMSASRTDEQLKIVAFMFAICGEVGVLREDLNVHRRWVLS